MRFRIVVMMEICKEKQIKKHVKSLRGFEQSKFSNKTNQKTL